MEFWDIYDENKKPTGRTMKEMTGVWKDGERYHLTVPFGVVGRPRWYIFGLPKRADDQGNGLPAGGKYQGLAAKGR